MSWETRRGGIAALRHCSAAFKDNGVKFVLINLSEMFSTTGSSVGALWSESKKSQSCTEGMRLLAAESREAPS